MTKIFIFAFGFFVENKKFMILIPFFIMIIFTKEHNYYEFLSLNIISKSKKL